MKVEITVTSEWDDVSVKAETPEDDEMGSLKQNSIQVASTLNRAVERICLTHGLKFEGKIEAI